MVSFDANVVLTSAAQRCIYYLIIVLLALAISITILAYVLWSKNHMQAVVHCDCRRIEGRKER